MLLDESISRSISLLILRSSTNKSVEVSEHLGISSIGSGVEPKNPGVSPKNSGVSSFLLPCISPTIPTGSVNFSAALIASSISSSIALTLNSASIKGESDVLGAVGIVFLGDLEDISFGEDVAFNLLLDFGIFFLTINLSLYSFRVILCAPL